MDGTLLPMDQDVFTQAYFGALCKALAPRFEPKTLMRGVWNGIDAMLNNDGSRTDESEFWRAFREFTGRDGTEDAPYFDAFYENDFDALKAACGFDRKASETVRKLKADGYRLALATNPVFPMLAQQKRLAWAGLDPNDFELITSYENSSFCKPNVGYYKRIAEKLGLGPAECLMAGNDVDDDMPAREIGMRVYLLTNCLINKSGKDIDVPHGDFDGLIEYIKSID